MMNSLQFTRSTQAFLTHLKPLTTPLDGRAPRTRSECLSLLKCGAAPSTLRVATFPEMPEEPSPVIVSMTNALSALPTLRLQNDDTIGLVTRSGK